MVRLGQNCLRLFKIALHIILYGNRIPLAFLPGWRLSLILNKKDWVWVHNLKYDLEMYYRYFRNSSIRNVGCDERITWFRIVFIFLDNMVLLKFVTRIGLAFYMQSIVHALMGFPECFSTIFVSIFDIQKEKEKKQYRTYIQPSTSPPLHLQPNYNVSTILTKQ